MVKMRVIGIAVIAAALLLAAIIAHAQAMGAKPQIGPDQIRILSAPASINLVNVKLLAVDINGFYQVVPAAPASLAVGGNGVLTLNVAAGQPTILYPTLNVPMVRQGDGSYTSTAPPVGRSMRVWRNGMLLYLDQSYAVDVVNASHILPMSAWSVDDLVTCDLIPVTQ